MYTVIIIMTLGMIIGFSLRSFDGIKINISKFINPIITWSIFLLLFFLGVSVGINEIIIKNLDIIGLKALFLTVGAVSGSVLVSFVTYKIFFNK